MASSNRSELRRLLTRARTLVRKGWTQGSTSRNKYGHDVRVRNPNAVRFCAVGALSRALGKGGDAELLRDAWHALGTAIRGDSYGGRWGESVVIGFNDSPGRTQREVVDTFTTALKSLQ